MPQIQKQMHGVCHSPSRRHNSVKGVGEGQEAQLGEKGEEGKRHTSGRRHHERLPVLRRGLRVPRLHRCLRVSAGFRGSRRSGEWGLSVSGEGGEGWIEGIINGEIR